MVKAADHPDAEAILVPDTAMHTLEIVDDLEAAIGKPVLTANQVTVWKGLDLLGPYLPCQTWAVCFQLGGRIRDQLHRAVGAGVDAEHHRRQASPGHRPW